MNHYPTPCVVGQTPVRKRFRDSLLNGDLCWLQIVDNVDFNQHFLSSYLTALLRARTSSSVLPWLGDLLLHAVGLPYGHCLPGTILRKDTKLI
jgi:hypothetical protein